MAYTALTIQMKRVLAEMLVCFPDPLRLSDCSGFTAHGSALGTLHALSRRGLVELSDSGDFQLRPTLKASEAAWRAFDAHPPYGRSGKKVDLLESLLYRIVKDLDKKVPDNPQASLQLARRLRTCGILRGAK